LLFYLGFRADVQIPFGNKKQSGASTKTRDPCETRALGCPSVPVAAEYRRAVGSPHGMLMLNMLGSVVIQPQRRLLTRSIGFVRHHLHKIYLSCSFRSMKWIRLGTQLGPCDDDSGESEAGEIVSSESVVSRRDATPIL
jgi:hypothetical protein